MYLEERFNEKWTWDAETKRIFPGLSVATLLFEHSYLGLQTQDIYMVYSMIDLVMSDLKC